MWGREVGSVSCGSQETSLRSSQAPAAAAAAVLLVKSNQLVVAECFATSIFLSLFPQPMQFSSQPPSSICFTYSPTKRHRRQQPTRPGKAGMKPWAPKKGRRRVDERGEWRRKIKSFSIPMLYVRQVVDGHQSLFLHPYANLLLSFINRPPHQSSPSPLPSVCRSKRRGNFGKHSNA